MTEIAFHVNTADKLAYACRLLRKALRSGSQVVVTGNPQWLARLDGALWTFAPSEFVPHCWSTDAAEVVARTPIVLADRVTDELLHDVLVNAGHDVPPGFERFRRVIEVVDQSDEDRVQARQRWKHYAARGYALVHQDLASKEAR